MVDKGNKNINLKYNLAIIFNRKFVMWQSLCVYVYR